MDNLETYVILDTRHKTEITKTTTTTTTTTTKHN